MNTPIDFLQSRTFMTHVTGLLSIVAAGWVMPNSTLASVAIAFLTGLTQASHAYQSVKQQQHVSTVDMLKALGK